MDRDIIEKKLNGRFKILDIKGNKLKLLCSTHGIFEGKMSTIFRTIGCPGCSAASKTSKTKYTLEEIKKKFIDTHCDKYDYSEFKYYNSITDKIKIICPIHGEFTQQINVHFNGGGCPSCKSVKISKALTYDNSKWTSEFIKIHGDKYDYSYISEKTADNKSKIICKLHGEFYQNLSIHKMGHGCPKCASVLNADNCRISNLEFIERSKEKHGDVYDYSQTKYTLAHDKVDIVCPKHGKFEQIAWDHLCGYGCPSCISRTSKAHLEIKDYIENIGFCVKNNDRTIIHPREIDILVESEKLCIEYDGLYWHSHHNISSEINKRKEMEKMEEIKSKGYDYLNIREDEWENKDKREIWKSKICYKLGKIQNKIHGRKCYIKEISKNHFENFCNINHLQGYRASKVKIGLFFKDDLVACIGMTPHKKFEWEVTRFCCKNMTIINGAFTKMLKFFISKYNPTKMVTYADRRYSDGDIYSNHIFKYDGLTKQNYRYVKGDKTFSRECFQKHLLKKKLNNYNENMTESDNMFNNGYRRLWDFGNMRFLWNK